MSAEKITAEDVTKVLSVVDKGLTSGMGVPKAGFMCVEAAVCYAFGEEHSDEPKCVNQIIRNAKIEINDLSWSSKKARARGMRRIAIAQLGSLNVDGKDWNTTYKEYCKKYIPNIIKSIFSKYNININFKEFKESQLKYIENIYQLESYLYDYNYNLDDATVEFESVKKLRKKITKKDEDELLTAYCEMAVKACKKHKTQGSKFLYLCDD